MRVAPAAAKRAATSQGARSYTFTLSRRPCSRRTAAPSIRSIAGKTNIGPQSSSGRDEAAQQSQARRLTFFRVELAAEHVVAAHGAGEIVTVLARQRHVLR